MPNRLTKPGVLLHSDGSVTTGWADSNLLDYNKIDCTAAPSHIQEWDRYTIISPECAVTLNIADLGSLGYVFVSLTDFRTRPYRTSSQTITRAYPRGRMNLPLSAKSGDTTYTTKQVGMRFSRSAKARFLNCEYVNFCEGKTLYLNLSLEEPDRYCIASATDFKKQKGFFAYRYQVTRMPAAGVIRYGGAEYRFQPDSSFGTLSWCRGVFPAKTAFHTVTLFGEANGSPLALFGGSSLESCVYAGGQFHKLEKLRVLPQAENTPWKFQTSAKGSGLEMNYFAENQVYSSFLINFCRYRQVFGTFDGAIAVSGKNIAFSRMTGFAESFESRL